MGVTTDQRAERTWEGEVLDQLARHASTRARLHDALLSFGRRVHLAVFNEPYLSYILEGKKTVESRFSANRCAPYGHVDAGDVVLLKRASGPIVAACVVDYVWSYALDPEAMAGIRSRFSAALCAQDPAFWSAREKANYATLMRVRDVVELGPIDCAKRDRRGWVVLQESPSLPFSLEQA